jgi:hypothetical protein
VYFRLTDHCRICYFQSDLILLDLRKDKYLILEKSISTHLIAILKHQFEVKNNKIILKNFPDKSNKIQLYKTLKKLQQQKIVTKLLYQAPEPVPQINTLPGANVDWRIERETLDQTVPIALKMRAFNTLIMVYFVLNMLGFYNLIKFIGWHKKSQDTLRYDKEFLSTLTNGLNQACFYFPIRVKCLEWASAYTIMALYYGLDCKINIGVQNQPFSAHAWVESAGNIVSDNPLMKSQLPVILTAPI